MLGAPHLLFDNMRERIYVAFAKFGDWKWTKNLFQVLSQRCVRNFAKSFEVKKVVLGVVNSVAGSFSNVVYSQVFHGAAGVMMISITCDGYILDCLALISCTSTTLSAIKLHCTTIIIGRVIYIMIIIKWSRRALTTSTHNLWASESIINYQLIINWFLSNAERCLLPLSVSELPNQDWRGRHLPLPCQQQR